jgi:hypothetical protein
MILIGLLAIVFDAVWRARRPAATGPDQDVGSAVAA